MSTDISMDESPKRELDPASRRLAERHEWEMQNLGYINGVHRDYGDDPDDIERKRPYRIENEIWYNTYKLGGGI